MNVTMLPRATMMFLGVTVLLLMVMVVVVTAPAGVVLGLAGDVVVELELVDPPLHAPIANAATAVIAAAAHTLRFVLIYIVPLDRNMVAIVTCRLTFFSCRGDIWRGSR